MKLWTAALADLLLLLSVCVTSFADTDIVYKRGSVSQNSVIPGLVNGTCDDDCINFIKTKLPEPLNLPNEPTYYISASVAPDANSVCSRNEPCGFDLIDTLLDQPSIVRIDGTFSDSGAELANWTGAITQTATGCGSDRHCNYLLPWDSVDAMEGNPPVIDCTELAGVIDGSTDQEALRIEGDMVVGRIRFQNCPYEPESTGSFRSAINVNGTGSNGHGTFIGTEVLNITTGHVHAFRNSSLGFVGLDIRATTLDNAIFDEDCATAGEVDPGDCAATLCDDTGVPYGCCGADSGGGDSQCIGHDHLVEMAHGSTIISDETFELNNSQPTAATSVDACFLSDCTTGDCRIFIDGPTCRPPAVFNETTTASRSATWFGTSPTDETGNKITTLSRVTGLAWPTTGHAGTVFALTALNADNSDTTEQTFNCHQCTGIGMNHAIWTSTQFAGDTVNNVVRCSVFDEQSVLSGDAFIFYGVGGANPGTINIDFDEDSIYDVDEGGADPDSYRFSGQQYKNSTTIDRSDPGSNGGNYNIIDLFGSTESGSEGSRESGGSGVDGDAFGGLSTIGTCTNSNCKGGCTSGPFVTELDPESYIRADIVGMTVKRVETANKDHSVGAK